MITPTTSGKIGEMLATAAILEMGFRVAQAQQDKVDLVAWAEDDPNLFLRVQVKSCDLTKRKEGRYQFNLCSGSKTKYLPSVKDHDLVVLVAVDKRRCVFYATETINQKTKRFTSRFFESEHIEYDSWHKALDVIKERRS